MCSRHSGKHPAQGGWTNGQTKSADSLVSNAGLLPLDQEGGACSVWPALPPPAPWAPSPCLVPYTPPSAGWLYSSHHFAQSSPDPRLTSQGRGFLEEPDFLLKTKPAEVEVASFFPWRPDSHSELRDQFEQVLWADS